MPLDHVNGERVEGMDEVFIVAEFDKYAEQTRLTTQVEDKRPMKRARLVEKPIVNVAMNHAATAFANSGLRMGSDIDILVQEYPRTQQICFIFCACIGGQDYLVTAPFQLADEQVRDLELRGLWTPYRVN